MIHPEYEISNVGIIKQHDAWVMQIDGLSQQPWVRINEFENLPVEGQKMTVAGWGLLEQGGTMYPNVLQMSNNSVYLSNDQCSLMLSTNNSGWITDDMMCAHEDGSGTCQGDSGRYGLTLVR